jgi:hypothetical protein
VDQISLSGIGGRSRMGISTMSSRWNKGTPAIVECTISPLATLVSTSSMLRIGWLRPMGRPEGVNRDTIASPSAAG